MHRQALTPLPHQIIKLWKPVYALIDQRKFVNVNIIAFLNRRTKLFAGGWLTKFGMQIAKITPWRSIYIKYLARHE